MSHSTSSIPLPKTITFCGGGNCTHVTAGYLASKGFTVNILTRRPDDWASKLIIQTKGCSWEFKGELTGPLNCVTNDPSKVIPSSDLILIGAPAFAHPNILREIDEHVKEHALVGTLFAQGGFDWAVAANMKKGLACADAVFGLQHVPWLSRIIEYGKVAQMIGPKEKLYLAASPVEYGEGIARVIKILFDTETFTLPNFLNLTLTPSNQIIHPARYYTIFKTWDGKTPLSKDQIQWGLYSEFDAESAMWLEKLDNELQKIKLALEKKFKNLDLSCVLPIKERVIKQYGANVKDTSTLETVFRTNTSYAGCVTPTVAVEGGFFPAVKSRLFLEDLPYGLCILKNLAELLNLETPNIDFMIKWHQQYMNIEYVTQDGHLNYDMLETTGCPAAYGMKSLQEVVAMSLSKNSCLK